MKRRGSIVLALCTVLSGMISGCHSAPKPVELPQTLQISAELPQEYPKEAAAYQLTWYEADERAAVDAFMGEEPSERIFDDSNSAIGPQYRGGGGRETLNLYTEQVKGGLSYAYQGRMGDSPENHPLRRQHPWEYAYGDLTSRRYGNEQMEAGGGDDLGFKPYGEVLEELEGKMDACGLPEHELLVGEAYTAAILNQNLDIYNQAINALDEAGKGMSPETLPAAYTEDDEFYYFQFRQVLDGIPFYSAPWARNAIGGGGSPTISAVYSQDGLIDFHAGSLCQPGGAVSTEPVISPEEALAAYVEEYSKAIHFENTEIISVELNYVIIVDSKGLYARPAWVITTAAEVKAGDVDNLDFDYTKYEVTAVSAYSGVILERETDMR